MLDQVVDIGPGGSGNFEVSLTGLQSGKQYYARAFAVTVRGTLYGNVVPFTTAAGGYLTGTFTDERDGHEYAWVQIGVQTWMADNLAWLPSVNPSLIGSYEQPHFYVFDYNGSEVADAKATKNYAACGVLYNWPAAMNACPDGWHLPGDEEWKQLELSLGMTQTEVEKTGIRGTDQGTQMKTTSGWLYGGNGTNSSGFSGFPGGYRDYDGPFESNAGTALWWSSTEFSETFSWYRCLNFDFTGVDRNGFYKSAGISIRCVKDPNSVSLATLITKSLTSISHSDAIGGGEITSDGGAIVTVRGICWNTTGNPTTNDNKTSDGQGIGSFTSILDDLTASTTYYVRAYATNSQGTAYGNEVTFTTTNIYTSGTFIDDRDSHEYKWVQIGEQTWMAENLAYLPSVSPPDSIFYTDPFYYVYDYLGTEVNAAKSTANYSTCGVLYNWPAVSTACPEGWHLPRDDEWKQLEMALGMTQDQVDASGWRGADQGTQMKTTSGWIENGNGTNSSGFSGPPGGCLLRNDHFGGLGYIGGWWSSTEYFESKPWLRGLSYHYSSVSRYYEVNEGDAYSVRCLRD